MLHTSTGWIFERPVPRAPILFPPCTNHSMEDRRERLSVWDFWLWVWLHGLKRRCGLVKLRVAWGSGPTGHWGEPHRGGLSAVRCGQCIVLEFEHSSVSVYSYSNNVHIILQPQKLQTISPVETRWLLVITLFFFTLQDSGPQTLWSFSTLNKYLPPSPQQKSWQIAFEMYWTNTKSYFIMKSASVPYRGTRPTLWEAQCSDAIGYT